MQWLENIWMHEQKWIIIKGGGCNEANILLYRGVMKHQGLMCQGSHANNLFVYYGHHKCCTRRLPSSLLQFSRVAHEDVNGHGLSIFTHWGWQQTSTSFFKSIAKKASSFSGIGAVFLETQLIQNYHDVQCPDYERPTPLSTRKKLFFHESTFSH